MGADTVIPSILLTDQHRDIEAASRDLMSCTRGDDPRDLIAAYRSFESMILAHIEAEEELLLAAYAEHFPETTRQIREEHAALRRGLLRVAIDVELHTVRLEQIEELLGMLRAHAGFEGVTLYRWADGNLSAEASAKLAATLDRRQITEHLMPQVPAEHTGYSR
jgi:hypothetical protein